MILKREGSEAAAVDPRGQAGPDAVAGERAGGASPTPGGHGLVYLGTSRTPEKGERVIVDPHRARVGKMRRVVRAATQTIQDEMQQGGFRYRSALITLTYRPGVEWAPDHMSNLMAHYRMWAKRRGFTIRGAWVIETTKRGIPHYHLVLFLPRGYTPPMPDKQGWWKHGMTNAKWARKPVGYICKYASKGCDGDLPHGARLFGVFGVPRIVLRYWRAPAWLRQMATPGDDIRRNGEWWENRSVGFAYRSPWIMDSMCSAGPLLTWVGWTDADVRFLAL